MITISEVGTGDLGAAWRALSDVESWPSLLPTVSSALPRGGTEGLHVGACFEISQPRLRKAEYVVTELEAGRCFAWRARTPGLTTTASHRVEAEPDGMCRVTLAIRWAGPLAFVARLGYSRLARSYMRQEASAVLRVAADHVA